MKEINLTSAKGPIDHGGNRAGACSATRAAGKPPTGGRRQDRRLRATPNVIFIVVMDVQGSRLRAFLVSVQMDREQRGKGHGGRYGRAGVGAQCIGGGA